MNVLSLVHLRNIHASTGAGRVARQLTEHLASQQCLNLPQFRPRVHSGAQMGSGSRRVPAKEKQNPKVSLSVGILRLKSDERLQLGDGQIRALLLQVLLCQLRMPVDLVLLAERCLANG